MHILHVASVDILPNSGMGRIACEWKNAFEKRGIQFTHIGWKELNKTTHPLLFGWLVRKHIINNRIQPDLILAHEPAAGFLSFKNIPLVVFSHGIEARNWEIQKKYNYFTPSIKARVVPLKWRFWSNNYGFLKATKILLSNKNDKNYLIKSKSIDPNKIMVFNNGYIPFVNHIPLDNKTIGCLFNASWIERKGTQLLVDAFNQLLSKYKNLNLFIAGTNLSDEKIKIKFLSQVQSQIIIIPPFSDDTEVAIYKNVSIFVLPSFFEGQSLALTQAMYMGLCPVVSDNSGQIDFIQNNINGLLFETGNTNSLIEKVETLINSPLLINEFGKAAKEYVKELEWKNVTDKLVDSIVSIINK